MAYSDWPEDLQEVYLNAIAFSWLAETYGTYTPGVSDSDANTAERLFEQGWVNMAEGTTPEIREMFYAYTEGSSADIDWSAWREFWGY